MRRLEGKIAIVAGGQRNIGAATALRLAEEGASVVVGAQTDEGWQGTAGRILEASGEATGAVFEATDDSSVGGLIARAVEAYGGLDAIFVNMADLSLHPRDT